MNVVEIDQTVEQWTIARNRAWLPSPRERQIRTKTFCIAGPEAGDFPSLAIKIAAEFSGNIKHARATAVVALVEHIARRPEVVRAAFRHFILRYFPRMFDVGNIHHMADGTHRNAIPILKLENGRKHFIAHK